ncbi:GtrA family protein [Novosphingobium sp. M1R2S20]|uniref:GtrA family protein n=1 Tax=Novosphingobium rhizovicinum TaxID=3228928 RepID=A0ABV3RCE4_9SPHN
MTLAVLVARYALFAVIATVANLGIQRLVLRAGEGMSFYIAAVFAGTLAGLVIKYALDKRWIFFDPGTGLRNHSQKFTLYTAMGVVTTAVFWATESLFWFVWQTQFMREFGAVLGLALGYLIKYRLDRRFVFTDAALQQGSSGKAVTQ